MALARELVGTTSSAPADAAGAAAEPTLQTARTAAGLITCAAPPLSGPGVPGHYAALASPWGADEPRWRDRSST